MLEGQKYRIMGCYPLVAYLILTDRYLCYDARREVLSSQTGRKRDLANCLSDDFCSTVPKNLMTLDRGHEVLISSLTEQCAISSDGMIGKR